MSASAQRASTRWQPEKAPNQSKNAPKFCENALRGSLDELLTFNARLGGGYADGMDVSTYTATAFETYATNPRAGPRGNGIFVPKWRFVATT